MKLLAKRKIYLDYAGATPIDQDISKKISQIDRDYFANPSAIYKQGQKVRQLIEDSRLKIANLFKAHSNEVIFCGSGTESDALAIIGVVNFYESKNKKDNVAYIIPHIVTSNIEHSAVLKNCQQLEKNGRAEITYVKVNDQGLIEPKNIKDAIKENTILVSVMYANNEIGTIEPIEEIAKVIRSYRKTTNSQYPYFHTDSAQAINYLPHENIEKLGVDLLSFNSSKIYGPKGVGILYKKRTVDLIPIYQGGGQEQGLRSGTESVSLIKGIYLALDKTFKLRVSESSRLINLRDYAIRELLGLSVLINYKIILNGHPERRLPNNINITIYGISSELLVIELDHMGIAVSERSACHSSDDNASYVIRAIRKTCERKKGQDNGSIRISLGRETTKSHLDFLVRSLKNILLKYKEWK